MRMDFYGEPNGEYYMPQPHKHQNHQGHGHHTKHHKHTTTEAPAEETDNDIPEKTKGESGIDEHVKPEIKTEIKTEKPEKSVTHLKKERKEAEGEGEGENLGSPLIRNHSASMTPQHLLINQAHKRCVSLDQSQMECFIKTCDKWKLNNFHNNIQ